MKIAGSGSASSSQKHGSADPDPDPHQNVMDTQHWSNVYVPVKNGGLIEKKSTDVKIFLFIAL